MTYTKTGTEFPDEAANAGLSDAAYRTHHEGVNWIYRLESMDLGIRRNMLRRFAGTARPEEAAAELVRAGYWHTTDEGWAIVHHADVIRQSLAAQLKHRAEEKERQQRKRGKRQPALVGAESVGSNVGSRVGSNVGSSVGSNVGTRVPPNAVSQSDKPDSHEESSSVWPEVAGNGSGNFEPRCRTCGGALRTSAELHARSCSAHLRGRAAQ